MAKLLGVDVSLTHTTPQHVLGERFFSSDGKEYVYVRSDATGVAVNSTVSVTSAWVATSGAANAATFGVANATLGANEYGWVQVRGQRTAKVTGTPASGTLLSYLSAASGNLQALVAVAEGGAVSHTAGAHAARAITQSAVSGGLATVLLY